MENGGIGHNTITEVNTPEATFDAQLPTPEQIPTAPETEEVAPEVQAEQDLPTFNPPVNPVDLAPEPYPVAPTGTIEEQNPEIAVDGDKMEKEWVVKTEKVINTNKQDPYREEIAINQLKADYMTKRFNRHLGDRNS